MSPPRVTLAALPTPLQRMTRLEAALGMGPLYVKRDDLTGFGVSGNKARALEYLVGAAVEQGADVLVAAGSASSNFCAAAALAAAAVGLECDLLFPGTPPASPSVNIQLARETGARTVFGVVETREELDDAVLRHAEALRDEGRKPYPLPRGGATPVGGLGYACAARELSEQCARAGVDVATVVVATGSGGTQAGLVAGRAGFGLTWHLVGGSVSRPAREVADAILRNARASAAILGVDSPGIEDVDVRDCRGAGFGVASEEDRTSARLGLVHEGLLLDDYYGAKAMTLFRTLLTSGAPTPAVFWHTGGVSATLTALTRGAP